MTEETITNFSQMPLHPSVLTVLNAIGYETPTPIQAQTMPLLLEGRDVVGQAQTGTGKTAAFAMPLLSRLDMAARGGPQVLVLAPTRELAIQVAEAFQKYARHLSGFHVLPIYGGQDYTGQIRALRRGVHVVVGTPGRVMDHMRRGTLVLSQLQALVLDEADEMLRMGFIDDVEWILQQTPAERQVALFSATMPSQIRRIAAQHLKNPAEVTIRMQTSTAETIRQRYWPVSGMHKLDALTRILEAEPFDAMIIFVRTKIATVELAEKLEARGHTVAPLSGDVQQKERERTIERLKNGRIDIVVATDVAARGLDVSRISHVVNYDIPHDTEAYVHRIGRTGRAGRQGDAILFVAPRERGMLSAIERATRQRIEQMKLPTTEQINDKRVARFKQRITDTIASAENPFFSNLIEQYQQEHNVPVLDIASALASLLQGDTPLLLDKSAERKEAPRRERFERSNEGRPSHKKHKRDRGGPPDADMERYRLEVGYDDNISPGNIVGAIANEANIDSKSIGRIDIQDDHTLVDLPRNLPADVLHLIRKARVAGRPLDITPADGSATYKPGKHKDKPKKKSNAAGKPGYPPKKSIKPGKPKKKKDGKNRGTPA